MIYSFVFFTMYSIFTNWQSDKLPVGLMIVHLVVHCTSIAEVIGLNPIQAWIFFQTWISQLLKVCIKERWSIINSYLSPQFKYMDFHILICSYNIVSVEIVYHLELVAAIPMELRRRWHLDSPSTASASSAGRITRNSFKPYLQKQKQFHLPAWLLQS